MFETLINNNATKSVALVTLALNPQLYYRKVLHALWQLYPHRLKTLMLLYQPDERGAYPTPIVNDMPFAIEQINVNKQWPEAWAWKWRAAIHAAKNRSIDYLVVFDEDDEYPPWWIQMMVSLIEREKADGCWSWQNIDVKRGLVSGYVTPEPYDAPSGAMVVSTSLMDTALEILLKKWPLGKRGENTPGTIDLTVCKRMASIGKMLNVDLRHESNRGYVRYGLANTNRRNPEDDIDFGFEYGEHLSLKIRTDEPARILRGQARNRKLLAGAQARANKKIQRRR